MPSGSPPAGVTTMSHKDGDGRSRDIDATWTRVRFPAAPQRGVSEITEAHGPEWGARQGGSSARLDFTYTARISPARPAPDH